MVKYQTSVDGSLRDLNVPHQYMAESICQRLSGVLADTFGRVGWDSPVVELYGDGRFLGSWQRGVELAGPDA